MYRIHQIALRGIAHSSAAPMPGAITASPCGAPMGEVYRRACKTTVHRASTTSGGPRGRRRHFRRSVAQWLEHRSPKPGVGGSSPSTPARTSAVDLKFLPVLRRARIATASSKPHWNHNVASVPLIPKLASGVLQVLASFGIGYWSEKVQVLQSIEPRANVSGR
jgi:hypothetical protein